MAVTQSMMSVTDTFKAIRATGCRVSRVEGEWRITPPDGNTRAAYFPYDNEDAVGTARMMGDK